MLMLEFLQWWYGPGWAGVLPRLHTRLDRLNNAFSVAILVRTLFAPWRRIISYPGAGLEAHMRAIGDNIVSRFVGFFVRITALIAAGVLYAIIALFGLLELVAWPVVPVASIGFVIWGIV